MAGQGRVVSELNGIVYRILQEADQPATNEIIASCMHEGEPMTTVTGTSLDTWRRFCELYTPSMCTNGLSLGAFLDGEQVGAVAGEDFATPEPDTGDAKFPGMDPVMHVIEEVEEELKKLYGIKAGTLPASGEFYHLWMVSVTAKAARRGVSKELFRAVLHDVAKPLGYKIGFAECTGLFSTRAGIAAGMTIPYVVDYATWKDSSGKVLFADAPEPHTGCSLTVSDWR